MIRYSFEGGMYYWTKPGRARSDVVRWLEAEYLELLELRERVKKAEEAAQRQEQRHEQRRRDTPKTVTNCIEPSSVPHSDRRHPPRRRPRR
jgi:hypothetical protein